MAYEDQADISRAAWHCLYATKNPTQDQVSGGVVGEEDNRRDGALVACFEAIGNVRVAEEGRSTRNLDDIRRGAAAKNMDCYNTATYRLCCRAARKAAAVRRAP